ncbi:hypothetical protein C8F01DRAFT_1124300 [Mycena amicta]|nr:hypothetical protein C8F01DRAFT_1124300 [Mycena amicta]
MYFQLPSPGPEALYHPPTMTWKALNRLPNIRPFLGWKTYPYVTFDDWTTKYKSERRLVYDRKPGCRDFEFTGVINDGPSEGGYVSVDACVLILTPTRLRPGIYHHDVADNEWKYYADPAEAPNPRSSYGFYRSVVDLGTDAIGEVWNLFIAMREPMMNADMRPGILVLARKDYGFAIPPGYRPLDVQWTAGCECSSLVKVCDYKIPENGCLEFRDRIAHGIPEAVGHFEVLSGAGDGIYPIQLIRDVHGAVTCVKVCFDGHGDVPVDSGCQFPSTGPSTMQTAAEEVERRRRRRSAGDVLELAKGFFQGARRP